MTYVLAESSAIQGILCLMYQSESSNYTMCVSLYSLGFPVWCVVRGIGWRVMEPERQAHMQHVVPLRDFPNSVPTSPIAASYVPSAPSFLRSLSVVSDLRLQMLPMLLWDMKCPMVYLKMLPHSTAGRQESLKLSGRLGNPLGYKECLEWGFPAEVTTL